MIIKEWPLCTLTPSAIGLDLHWPTRSAGEALGGDEQIASALSARWQMSLSFDFNRKVQQLAYRGVKAGMKGRYTAVRFTIWDPYRVTITEAGGFPVTPPGIPWSDEVFFDDGTGFSNPSITTLITADSALRQEDVQLDVSAINDALHFGHFITIADPSLPADRQQWLYMVTEVGIRIGDNRIFGIAPPLRNAVSIGDEAEVGRTSTIFRLRDDLSGAGQMQYGRFGSPSMDFVEVMRRAEPAYLLEA